MKKFIAEFVGTMMLVIFGCGSAVCANTLLGDAGQTVPLAYSTLLIAFAFGLVIVALAYSIGNVSGCHINPAVSLGMLIMGRIKLVDFFSYIVAQFAGGIAGAGVLTFLLGDNAALGANTYGGTFGAQTVSMPVALVIEVILTFVFVLAVIGVTSKTNYIGASGLVIGLSLTLVHILGIPFTGTSVNPARSFGPALIQGGEALSQVWVFIVAPLVGGALAALFYMLISDVPSRKRSK